MLKRIAKKIIISIRKYHLYFLLRGLNDLYHNYWYRKLLVYFKEASKNMDNQEIINSKNIWVLWWQGTDSMPDIVKTCYKSICKHSNGHNVVLITKDNYKKYTHIDSNILKNFNNGDITLTTLSDVIRFNLLKYHGGLWMDSTVYVNEDIKEEYFSNMFTVGINDKYHDSVNGGYSGFLFGGCNNQVINFMDEFFKTYYKYNASIGYYFTIDEGLNYCYKNNLSGFKDYVDNHSFNSDPHLHSMAPMLNSNYDDNLYNKNYGRFYKLTYKMDFDDRNDTFYHRIVHNIKPFNIN
jgi:hypothetical protein